MTDWLGFLCGTQLPAQLLHFARHPGDFDPSNFNSASIAISALAGSRQ